MTAPSPDSPQARPPTTPQSWEQSGAVPPPGYVAPPPLGGYPVPPGAYPVPPGGYAVPPGAYPVPPGGYPYQQGQMMPPGFGLPPRSPGGQPLASFGDRLLAYLVDTAVLTAIAVVIGTIGVVMLLVVQGDDILGAQESEVSAVLMPILILEAVLFAVGLGLTYAYYVEFIRRTGQTLGKKVMHLKVVPLDPAATLTRGHCVRRYLVQWVAGALVPFFSYVDGFWQLWDKPYQQCLHDRFAQTVVVKVPTS